MLLHCMACGRMHGHACARQHAALTLLRWPLLPPPPRQVSTFRNRNLRMPEDADLAGEIKAGYVDGVGGRAGGGRLGKQLREPGREQDE